VNRLLVPLIVGRTECALTANYCVRYRDAKGVARREWFGDRTGGPLNGRDEALAFKRQCEEQGLRASYPQWV
jgi:hypothetical protein